MATDSTIVHYSGSWALNNGAVAAGALLTVYDSGTSNLASIFTNSTLATASANPITADANGLLPFAWIGSTAYKVRLTTSGGTLIDEQDVIDGAIDTDQFLAGDFAKPDQDFNSKTGNYTVVSGDLGTIINCDCSGGAFDITMMSAVTATNGKGVTIRHTGTANTVGIVTVSSQTITSPTTGVTTTAFELISYGESVTIESDGANWHVTRYVPPLLRPNTPGVIKIADRVSAAPSSSPGTRYIVAAAFSTFEQEDIIEDNGQGGFIEITPPTDCGWVAYVQDEDCLYQFIGSAWVQLIPHIPGLTAETTVDGTADHIPFYDASATAPRKTIPSDIKRAGGLQLLNSGTVSAAATLDVALTSFTAYRGFVFTLANFIPATDDVELWMRFSTDGGSTFDAASYAYTLSGAMSNGDPLGAASDSAAQIVIAGDQSATESVSNVANEGGASVTVTLLNPAAAVYSRATYETSWMAADTTFGAVAGGGILKVAQNTDAVRFLFESGNITSGSWALYGFI